MKVREAATDDAPAMSCVLQEIVAHSGRQRKTDATFVLSNYVKHPQSVRCTVAVDEEQRVFGFQSLIRAWPENPYGVPLDWGIIGTHISPHAHRRGAGSALFAATKAAAEMAGLPKIDAFIGADNQAALRYYEAMGFRTYRELDDVVQKAYAVESSTRE
ncbi:MAG: GNAT family N-acetyltransferase [Pseudomonadota bacterium]